MEPARGPEQHSTAQNRVTKVQKKCCAYCVSALAEFHQVSAVINMIREYQKGPDKQKIHLVTSGVLTEV